MLKNYKVDIKQQHKIIERVNRERLYTQFVSCQEKGFIRFINYVNTELIKLKEEFVISPNVKISARIKSIDSALNNFKKHKTLDDVFGIEITCDNEEEIFIIKNVLETNLTSTKTKIHDKVNGYKAVHESYSVIKNQIIGDIEKWDLKAQDVPVVECQFKTLDVKLNPIAAHNNYKEIDKLDIQKKLEKSSLRIGKEIPRMWGSTEKGMVELSYKEIIQKIYPFVDIKTIKEQEGERNK